MSAFFLRVRIIFLFCCLVSLPVGVIGCGMYHENNIGSLNGRGQDIYVGQIELKAELKQKNDFGFDCIPTHSNAIITAYISNPKDFQLDTTIGTLSSTVNTIRISNSILPFASVVQSDADIIQVALPPVDPSFEHTDFTISFSPVTKDKEHLSIQVRSITVRYNTPPRVPFGVVVDDQGKFSFLKDKPWGVVSGTGSNSKDGYIFWAWPQGMTLHSGAARTAADCVASFVLNGRAYTPRECAINETLTADDGTIYDLYRLYVGKGGSVKLYAKDVESVRSGVIVSGEMSHKVSFNANGGRFEDFDSEIYEVYRQNGFGVDLGYIPVPTSQGNVFLGWSADMSSVIKAASLSLESDLELKALWLEEALVVEVMDLSVVHQQDDGSLALSWNPPYASNRNQTKISWFALNGEELGEVYLKRTELGFALKIEDMMPSSLLVQTLDGEMDLSRGIRVHSITLMPDKEEGRPRLLFVVEGSPVPFEKESERPGFVFKGWYLDESRTKRFAPKQLVSESAILYPKWEQKKVVAWTDKEKAASVQNQPDKDKVPVEQAALAGGEAGAKNPDKKMLFSTTESD